jgi:hypothetical protein
MVEAIDPPVLRDPYHGLQPLVLDGGTSYAISPPAKLRADRVVEYPYGLGEVVTAAVRAGPRIAALTEYLDEEVESRGRDPARRGRSFRPALRGWSPSDPVRDAGGEATFEPMIGSINCSRSSAAKQSPRAHRASSPTHSRRRGRCSS